MAEKNKKLVIVTGASRGIGKSFLDRYRSERETNCVGINRTGSAGNKLDLMDGNTTYKFVRKLDLENVPRVIYIHSVGIDKFEPRCEPHIDHDGDGIDDEVLASNLTTFLHFVEPLIDRTSRKNIPLTICCIGSVSDIYEVPFWQSFYRVKNKVRRFCKSINDENVSSLILNVSSTLDEEGRTFGRKKADTTYWQTTDELVDKSFSTVDRFKETGARYAEFDYFKHNPSFREDYFTNLPKLYSTWQRDLGFAGKEIPKGILI